MRRSLVLMGVLGAVAVLVVLFLRLGAAPATSQASKAPATPWNEPDLQGIWTDEYQTPLQRPERFAGREFMTEEEQAELDRQRGAMLGRDRRGQARTERDVAGAYNAVFES